MTAAKSNVPWSVKGIERTARETAKEAAHRQGMTVGAWLNQMIYAAGDPERSGGVVEGVKLKDIITAIEALNARVAKAESRSAEAVDRLVRNFGGVVERVQRLERGAGGSNAELAERVQLLEEKSADRTRIDALRALEKAVGQVALQFDTVQKDAAERLEAQEEQLKALAARIDKSESDPQAASAINYLKNAVDGLGARISRAERIASEASQLNDDAQSAVDAEFVERTGARLRVLGDEIKRGGDQIRALENAIVKMATQIDAAEKRSAEGVRQVSETIVALREQFETAEPAEGARKEDVDAAVSAVAERTEARISALQQSFAEMIARLEKSAAASAEGRASSAAARAESEPDTFLDAHAGEPAPAEDPGEARIDLDADEDAVEDADAGGDPDRESDPFDLDLAENGLRNRRNEAEDILAEVREAFSGADDHASSDDPDERGDREAYDAPPPVSSDDDLDAVLSELEDLGEAREPSDADRGARRIDDDPFLGDLGPLDANAEGDREGERPETPRGAPASAGESEEPAGPTDYLKAARQAARAAAEAAPEEPVKRRKLSPKQRAILSARIKRKREEAAAAQNAGPLPAGAKDGGAKPAGGRAETSGKTLAPDVIDYDDEEEEDNSGSGSITAKFFSGLKNRRPRDKAEEKAEKKSAAAVGVPEDAEADDDYEEDEDEDDLAEGARSSGGLGVRPVTIALAASTVLAIVALSFMMKDVFLSPPSKAPEARVEISKDDAPGPVADARGAAQVAAAGEKDPAGGEAVAEVPDPSIAQVPAAPTVKPRDLYLESVAALQNAQSAEEEAQAVGKIKEAAALGHPPAQLQIGEFYKTGQGVDEDIAEARKWYERAAEGGNILAMHRVGVMTAQGEGGPADLNIAIEWFEKAANRALVDSQYNLGAIYHPSPDGAEGVQNAETAYYWYSLAGKNGDEQAAALAAGLAAAIDADRREELNASVERWAPTPANPAANEIAPAS